ncbi:DUF2871 domain-containing protein [Treponema sp. OMZ 840]|uniref:DUF2871 domain-containing protein n=1 Tax=Treponema sp. OMZ 840 TaxID=244313 RepID=UPI003D92C988
MKKYLNTAFIYAIAALAGGVFYREFTKWNGFSGTTALGKVHPHLFLLGTVIFLFAALFSAHKDLSGFKSFRVFLKIYNIGVPLTAIMMIVRGIPQVLDITLSKALDASVSGIAGIGHILTGTGLILFLLSLKKAYSEK